MFDYLESDPVKRDDVSPTRELSVFLAMFTFTDVHSRIHSACIRDNIHTRNNITRVYTLRALRGFRDIRATRTETSINERSCDLGSLLRDSSIADPVVVNNSPALLFIYTPPKIPNSAGSSRLRSYGSNPRPRTVTANRRQ